MTCHDMKNKNCHHHSSSSPHDYEHVVVTVMAWPGLAWPALHPAAHPPQPAKGS